MNVDVSERPLPFDIFLAFEWQIWYIAYYYYAPKGFTATESSSKCEGVRPSSWRKSLCSQFCWIWVIEKLCNNYEKVYAFRNEENDYWKERLAFFTWILRRRCPSHLNYFPPSSCHHYSFCLWTCRSNFPSFLSWTKVKCSPSRRRLW